MKLLYPAAEKLSDLSESQLALKIARHSSCSSCNVSCVGLRPPRDVQVALDDSNTSSYMNALDSYGSDDEDSPSYLTSCICGHGVPEHGADASNLGEIEFMRRGRAAIRLDELLKTVGF
ncbi:hypothetical protein FIBSPDRAFT_283 [Athelia psychrophila]|uniref:Uncharacterized protein n=1 Tax=Athelia psychrophila TaxID=1759441 RepID=A0A166WVA7_9AGAM|nr:hypothetical protein FIBSPDRAFT_283 [Fibularhizoctonia sp. CBS 109695]